MPCLTIPNVVKSCEAAAGMSEGTSRRRVYTHAGWGPRTTRIENRKVQMGSARWAAGTAQMTAAAIWQGRGEANDTLARLISTTHKQLPHHDADGLDEIAHGVDEGRADVDVPTLAPAVRVPVVIPAVRVPVVAPAPRVQDLHWSEGDGVWVAKGTGS